MIENRKLTQIKLGNGHIIHRVILESILCPEKGEKARIVKHGMLEQLSLNPELSMCGDLDFETFLFKYVAERWVIELKATEAVPET